MWVAGDLSGITALALAGFLHALEEWFETIIYNNTIVEGGIILIVLGHFEVDDLKIVSLVRVFQLIQILSVARMLIMYIWIIEDSCQ